MGLWYLQYSLVFIDRIKCSKPIMGDFNLFTIVCFRKSMTCDVQLYGPRALSAQAWTRGLALSWARASRMETLVCRCCPDPRLPTYLYRTEMEFLNGIFVVVSGHKLKSSHTQDFVWFSTLIFPCSLPTFPRCIHHYNPQIPFLDPDPCSAT